MAQSRLYKLGSIFSRATGLLESKAIRLEEKPIWFDVYAMHPPDRPPRYDREVPNTEVRDIFYEEDIARAKFHQHKRLVGTYAFEDNESMTPTQEFIETYKKLKAQGALDEQQIYKVALEKFGERVQAQPYRFEEQFEEEQPAESVKSQQQDTRVEEKPEKPKLNLGDVFDLLKQSKPNKKE